LAPDPWPIDVLLFPGTTPKALVPTAVLKLEKVIFFPAPAPIAVFLSPEVKSSKAFIPTPVFFWASFKVISLAGSSTFSTISTTFWILISPLSLSIITSIL
jgi:hypothetical protein